MVLLMQPLDPEQTAIHQWAGVSGLFVSIISTTLATSILLLLANFRSLRIRISAEEADQIIPQTFEVLFPSLITLTFFILIKLLISSAASQLEISLSTSGELVSINNPHQLIYHLLKLSFSEVKNELNGLFFLQHFPK